MVYFMMHEDVERAGDGDAPGLGWTGAAAAAAKPERARSAGPTLCGGEAGASVAPWGQRPPYEHGDEGGQEDVPSLLHKLDVLLEAGDEGNWRDMVCVRKLAALKHRLMERQQREARARRAQEEKKEEEEAVTVTERTPSPAALVGVEAAAASAREDSPKTLAVRAALEKIDQRFVQMGQQAMSEPTSSGSNGREGVAGGAADPAAPPGRGPSPGSVSDSSAGKIKVLRRTNSSLRMALAGTLCIDHLDPDSPYRSWRRVDESTRDAVLYEYVDAREYEQRALAERQQAPLRPPWHAQGAAGEREEAEEEADGPSPSPSQALPPSQPGETHSYSGVQSESDVRTSPRSKRRHRLVASTADEVYAASLLTSLEFMDAQRRQRRWTTGAAAAAPHPHVYQPSPPFGAARNWSEGDLSQWAAQRQALAMPLSSEAALTAAHPRG
eukprot:ctg_3001.g528